MTVASSYALFLGQWKTSNNTIWTITEDVKGASYNISGLSYGTTPVVIKATYNQSKTCFTVYAQDNLGFVKVVDKDNNTYENCPLQLLGGFEYEGEEKVLTVGDGGAYCVFTASLDSEGALLLSPGSNLTSGNYTFTSFCVYAIAPDGWAYYYSDCYYMLPNTFNRISSNATSSDSPGNILKRVAPTIKNKSKLSLLYCKSMDVVAGGAANGRVRKY